VTSFLGQTLTAFLDQAEARAAEHHPLEVEQGEQDGEPFPRLV
jgi:hypothetical protein